MNDQSLETFEEPIATPRTDAATSTRSGWVQNIVSADFARTLERELVQKESEVKQLKAERALMESVYQDQHKEAIQSLKSERDKLKSENEDLRAESASLRQELKSHNLY